MLLGEEGQVSANFCLLVRVTVIPARSHPKSYVARHALSLTLPSHLLFFPAVTSYLPSPSVSKLILQSTSTLSQIISPHHFNSEPPFSILFLHLSLIPLSSQDFLLFPYSCTPSHPEPSHPKKPQCRPSHLPQMLEFSCSASSQQPYLSKVWLGLFTSTGGGKA